MTTGTIQPNTENIDPTKVLPNLHERLHQLEEALTAIGFDAKASKRRRFPSKRQQSVLHSITRALCVETIDPWKENRVRFYHPLLHDPDTKLMSLPFAQPVSPFGGIDDSGVNWVPPAGSTIMVFFEGGSRDAPFYLGTTWHRDRGPGGRDINSVFISREWNSVYANSRAGNFLHGPDDGSQVLPPWNTESYNAGDITQLQQFSEDPLEQKRMTYPNIYGFKTPEKHMLKMVDGDAKCNRRWKRLELMSGDGSGWLCFKDDHLHYGGQWSHPDCPPSNPGAQVDVCANTTGNLPYFSDIHGTPIEGDSDCGSPILGGHPSTPCEPDTPFCNSNAGSNKFFKARNECRPYRGPGTPQNNRCDLPQSGVQLLSGAGDSFVMDNSVEEPRGRPGWQRSNDSFDFGCTDKYMGRMYMREATGHEIMMSGIEELTALRGKKNFIRIKTATGNRIELNDHTIGSPDATCPPNYGGELRGITMESSSKHVIKMIDHMNLQCSPKRMAGGIPEAKATRAYIQIRSGYGLEMRFNDDFSQEKTQSQWIQIMHPQCADPQTDSQCNSGSNSACRGPHFLRFQGRPKGQPGVVFLRAGGHSIRQTYDMDIVLVGDKEKNPSDKFTYVSKKLISISEDIQFHYTADLHITFSEKQILLMSGRDCPPAAGKKCKGPCLFSVIVARCPVFCPLTGILHWTEKAMSERVFASAYSPCQGSCGGGGCAEYDSQMAAAQGAPCKEDGDEIEQEVNGAFGSTGVDPNGGSTEAIDQNSAAEDAPQLET